jgi:ubiquinone biosynthesis protein UbiJ
MTENERLAELERLHDKLKKQNRSISRIGDEWLKRVARDEINATLAEIKRVRHET